MMNIAVLLNNQGVNLLTKTSKDAGSMDVTTIDPAPANDDCRILHDAQWDNQIAATTINPEDLNDAIAHFEAALILIVRSADVYRNESKLQPSGLDGHGMIQFEDECIGARLIGSLNLQDTGVRMKGNDNESFIHWKAVKIGNDDYNLESSPSYIDGNEHDGSEYRHLSAFIFHLMICTYNLGLCYQYKGIQTSSRSWLDASVDHYIQSYDFATRFQFQHIEQYTLLMATMNNLATTYSFLNKPEGRDIFNNYLLSTLILLKTSEEGRNTYHEAIRREDPRSRVRHTTYQNFLSNVMYLISPQDNVASAA